jgi:hypothetical protein
MSKPENWEKIRAQKLSLKEAHARIVNPGAQDQPVKLNIVQKMRASYLGSSAVSSNTEKRSFFSWLWPSKKTSAKPKQAAKVKSWNGRWNTSARSRNVARSGLRTGMFNRSSLRTGSGRSTMRAATAGRTGAMRTVTARARTAVARQVTRQVRTQYRAQTSARSANRAIRPAARAAPRGAAPRPVAVRRVGRR